MRNIPQEAQRQFLIGISRKHFDSNTDFDEIFRYTYLRPNDTDNVYKRIANIAFTTLARNNKGLRKNPNYTKIHDESRSFLADALKSIDVSSQAEYDAWHKDTMEGLIRIFHKYGQAFTIGKAQKWINMAIKHLAIYSSELTDSYYDYAHIPIDSYIIAGLRDKIDCTFGQDPKHYIAWNNIDDYGAYLKFQKDFREYCGEAPLDAEFHLWMKERRL